MFMYELPDVSVDLACLVVSLWYVWPRLDFCCLTVSVHLAEPFGPPAVTLGRPLFSFG